MKSDRDFLETSYSPSYGLNHRSKSIYPGILQQRFLVILLSCLLLYPFSSHSQQTIDSLLNIVESSQGRAKVDIYNQLSYEYSFISLKEARTTAEYAFELANTLQYKEGQARSMYQLGLIAYLEGDFAASENLCIKALDIALKVNDNRTACECYKTLGILYEESNALHKSLENYEKAHEIELEIGNPADIAHSSLTLGMIYRKRFDRSKAEQYIDKAWDIYSSINNIQGMATTLAESGKLFMEMNELDTARSLLFQAISITELANNDYLSLKVFNYFIEYYRQVGIPDSAIYYGKKAFAITKSVNDPIETHRVLLRLSEDYAAAGNYEKAREYHQQYSLLRDSLFKDNEARGGTGTTLNNPDQVSQKKVLPGPLSELWSKNYFWILIISGGLLIGIILVVLFKRYSDKSSDILIIEEQKGQLLELSNHLAKKEEEIKLHKDKIQRLRKQNQTLRDLFSEDEYEPERIESRIHELTRIIAENLDADQVGLWKFIKNDKNLEALDQYNRVKDQHLSGEIIDTAKYPLYFEALKNAVSIKVLNVKKDSRTAEFNQDRNHILKIKSRMDVPIIFRGTILGIIWTEYTSDYREFPEEDEGFLLSTATMAGELLVKHKRADHENKIIKETEASKTVVSESQYTRLKGIIASLNTAVFVLDSNLKIVLFNPGAEERFGHNAHKILKEKVSEILKGGNDNSFYIELKEFITSGKDYIKKHQIIEFINFAGAPFQVFVGISTVKIEDDDYITCIFLGDKTDDIPATSALGEINNYFVLDQDELVREPLNDILKEIVDRFDSITTNKLIFHYSDKPLPPTNIYRTKLIHAINIIIENAISSIGESGDIYVQSEINYNYLNLSIVDTGEGLSNEKRKQAFDPFVMDVDKSQLRGMGLVRWIIELHGGKVKINSRLGKGTQVTIIIPAIGN